MTVPHTLARAVDELRRDLDVHATDPATQRRYEAWTRRDTWHLRDEAAPLLVGLEPTAWQPFIADPGRAPLAEALTLALARDVGADPGAGVSPLRVRTWAQAQGIRLPLALSRLLDFIACVLPQAAAADSANDDAEVRRAQERETLLGAALMLVTKEQAACLDDDGYYSALRIAKLIRARALLWFPLAPPALDEAAIAALIARWIEPPAH